MTAPWIGRVICPHEAVLGREETVTDWSGHASCVEPGRVGRWAVAVIGDAARTQVLDTLASIVPDAPVAGAIARLSRADLPRCSVLLSDGEYAAGLAWGEPLGLADLGGWEYALSAAPLDRGSWSPLSPGTIVVLDSCGPVVFPVPFLQEI
ncbi:hypothetical protein Back2_08830 [Nocardioides baekrokdamisoli]|uniref:Uncharacterized protein n=1 Tax=Nocardioides baekrokdamisoli TaxID=1804624 RepID=A0A3G9IE18_9ACTN|nr:hypothetical protein [Nocardioides baekrokdamisoli]BBH16596.1 hypothetical protein Back2_08830 [Nocardioides baekrokdamisoli]